MEPSFAESQAKAIRDAEESIAMMEKTIIEQEAKGYAQASNKAQLEKLRQNLIQIRETQSPRP